MGPGLQPGGCQQEGANRIRRGDILLHHLPGHCVQAGDHSVRPQLLHLLSGEKFLRHGKEGMQQLQEGSRQRLRTGSEQQPQDYSQFHVPRIRSWPVGSEQKD